MIDREEYESSDNKGKLELIQSAKQSRRDFQTVFSGLSGSNVLAWIANECGECATDPQYIDPSLAAFYHRLLHEIGINQSMNTFRDIEARLAIANVEDLISIEKGLEAKEGT